MFSVKNSMRIDPVSQRYVVALTNRTGDHDKATQLRLELAESVIKDGHIDVPNAPGLGIEALNEE